MNEEKEKSQLPPFSDFLNIYPPLSNNNNNAESKKYFVYFGPIKQKSQKILEKIKNKHSDTIPNTYPILLEKILKQQKNKIARTPEVKESIKSFLSHSNLIQKLQNYFSNQNNDSENNLVNLEQHINTVIEKKSII